MWSLLFTTVSAALLDGVPPFLTSRATMDSRIRILLWQGLAGLALGLCLYVVNLPYMLLMFRSSFFRQRFRTWLEAAPES